VADLDGAIAVAREAVVIEAESPRFRVDSARNWGRAAAVGGRWREAVEGFETAIELLGRATPRSLVWDDLEHRVESFAGLASDAAACCVQAGLVDRAIELLEQGRGILLSQALDIRTDMIELTGQYPDLAERFIALRDGLAVGTPDPLALERREMSEALESVVAQVGRGQASPTSCVPPGRPTGGGHLRRPDRDHQRIPIRLACADPDPQTARRNPCRCQI